MTTQTEIFEQAVLAELKTYKRRLSAIEARQNEIWNIMLKEYPKYFAGEHALVIATNNENLGGETLPDLVPVDLRTEDEKLRGDSFHLSDFVTMEGMTG